MRMIQISKSSHIVLSFVAVCVFIACANATSLAQAPLGKSRITVASGVRVRAMPNTTAEEVTKLGIGTLVQELEQSANKERIGGVEDFWYRISAPGGKDGWVFGSFTAPFDTNNRVAIYRRIAAERLKAEQTNFTDMADLGRFLSSVVAEATQPDATAELELARLTAIRRAAEALPTDKQEQPPYQTWIKANEALIVYSEPGGQWMIKAAVFWELAKQYRALSIGERIAWEASKLPLPGECEGDPVCLLGALNLTSGKYLNLYPRGLHAEAAMKDIIESLASGSDLMKSAEPVAAEYKADALKEVTTLRTAIQGTASPSKARALELIKSYETYVRR
jgi:Bacterial SH3 domain